MQGFPGEETQHLQLLELEQEQKGPLSIGGGLRISQRQPASHPKYRAVKIHPLGHRRKAECKILL